MRWPAGATETQHIDFGTGYVLYLETDQSLADLEAFWTQAVPAADVQLSGHFSTADSLTVAFTNPDGGMVATKDPSTGKTAVIISVGTSQYPGA